METERIKTRQKSKYDQVRDLAEGEFDYLGEAAGASEQNDGSETGETREQKSYAFFENQLWIMELNGAISKSEKDEFMEIVDNMDKSLRLCYQDVMRLCEERSEYR